METSPFKDSNLLMISFLTCVVELAFTSWLCIRQNHDRLYETANGTNVNADMNGALNILRKAFPEIEIELTDLQYLKNPQVFSCGGRDSVYIFRCIGLG